MPIFIFVNLCTLTRWRSRPRGLDNEAVESPSLATFQLSSALVSKKTGYALITQPVEILP